MARRRKSDSKPVTKAADKPAVVRKSRRQIAKKQLDKKVNGESATGIIQSNDSEDIGAVQGSETNLNCPSGTDQSVVQHKKFGKYKCPNDEESKVTVTTGETNLDKSVLQTPYHCEKNKKDIESGDSQEANESMREVKLNDEESRREIVIGVSEGENSTVVENCTEEVVWQEDVIEETIEICEEMEVEDEGEESYTISQDDGSVLLEEVLLVNNHDFEGEGVVEFTVIRNEDGTESMVVARDDQSLSCKEYIANSLALPDAMKSIQSKKKIEHQIVELSTEEFNEIEKGVENINVNETEFQTKRSNLIEPLKVKQSASNCYSSSSEHPFEIKKDIQDEVTANDPESHVSVLEISPTTNCEHKYSHENNEGSSVLSNNEGKSNIDNSLGSENPSADLDELKISPESSNMFLNHVQMTSVASASSISFSDVQPSCKNEQLMEPEVSKDCKNVVQPIENLDSKNTQLSKNNEVDKFRSKETLVIREPEEIKKPSCIDVAACLLDDKSSVKVVEEQEKSVPSADVLSTIKVEEITSKKKDTKEMGTEDVQNNDEYSGDSEMDTKADTEDIKVSSSSENSNDTLLSSNSYKLPEFCDIKNIPNQHNDVEKKTGFRSRSGSTDTTGSESGSNSSGVRRSSRIRSIGLMKQRSRGRGLVTKPNLDLSRAIFQHQEREKLGGNLAGVFSQESKDNSDNQSETQSDKESSGNKTMGFLDSPAPLAISVGTAGYESDTSKPVKVKSRWRRSSELEMGGNGSVKIQQILSESDASVENVSNLLGSPSTELAILPVSKTIVGKSSLTTVPEIKDREMEERLSQFEHLRENLYLTERYTNKETKRMVCDCFLTDEEIARGELGCGEDCLNRLLMIECGPRCIVGERCTNKRFQNCEYAKCEVFRTDKKGFGLRAIVDLQCGEFLMEYVGEVVDPKDFRRRAKDYSKDKNRHYYFMALKSDQIIDATAKGNISRFINHSCDPNSETQKWTVNGELRIGFFNKQFIAAGEEITFDYHFQRYGKEAQKCFCEAENCRGWIGDTPEEEKEKTEKKEKSEKDVKKKKEEKIIHDYMEDEDLEEEIDKLCSGGLKNRSHTLTLSRLMVRSREIEHRTRLLRLIQSGEQPCRRLFLDYHGLRLIWSYMMDVGANASSEAQNFRLEILKTLNTLPIPNKTMLMDSKVFGVVEKWAEQVYSSPTSGSPDDDQSKTKISSEEPDSSCDVDSNEKVRCDGSIKEFEVGIVDNNIKNEADEECRTLEEQTIFTELAKKLLSDWSNLKEVFRIPKKERIEQMKEHEREADRGYKEDLEKEDRRDKSYDRSYRSDRYGRSESDKRSDRRRGRESPEFDYSRGKDKRAEERMNLVPIPRMSKYERRQLFAMKVAKEEEERQRRQQQETWQEHEARCLALGMDPHTSAALDPQTGYPLFFNPSLGQWQMFPPIQDATELTPQCPPVYLGTAQPLAGQPGMITPNPHMIPSVVPPPVFSQSQQATSFGPMNPAYPVLTHHHEQFAEGQLQISSNLIPIQNGASQVLQEIPMYVDKTTDQVFGVDDPSEIIAPIAAVSAPSPPPLDLPPKWKSAKDVRGRTYYYNVTERIPQWLPPPPDHFGGLPETSSSSESSEESSSSDEDDEEIDDEDGDEEPVVDIVNCAMEVDPAVGDSALIILKGNIADKVDLDALGDDNLIVVSEPKKRRDGLVQERIISPRREEERVDHKKYKETKDKLRRQKEKAKLKEHADKLKKHRRSGKSKSHSRHTLSKIQAITADPSTTLERKIKDTFRINMANVMVHFLNPYRKNDCKQGRITNTEDFKHLARKLTHFVLAKELKHCKSVDELQCNENVKHKAKDFVRKYMSKFGAVYQKGSDED